MTAQRWLVIVLVLHFALGQAYAWATPIFEAPDEGTHFAFVHWLATGHALPVQDPGATGLWEQEGSQPPLYYALVAALVGGLNMADFETRLVDYPLTQMGVPGTPHGVNRYRQPLGAQPLGGTALAVLVARQFSLLLSVATVGLTYALSRVVFPESQWLALLAAALVAFNPMALFINASVNNDNLLMLLSTATLVACVRLMPPTRDRRLVDYAALGALLGLAALTKISGLVLWPIAALALVAGHWSGTRTSRFRRSAACPAFLSRVVIVLVFGLALLISGWWYWRNLQLYGEWLGLNTMVAIAGPRAPAIGLVDLVVQEWRGFVLSFWAVFGVFTILPARWVQVFYDALVLVALVGGGVALLRSPRRLKSEAALLALFCALTLAGVVRWTLQTPASQGRLMFGAIAPLSLFLAAGLLAVAQPLLRPRAGRNWTQGYTLTLSAGLALVAGVIPVAYIAPRYAPPPLLTEADLPADLRPVQAVFANTIELVGYTAGSEVVKPGDHVRVTLYWRALAPMKRDYALALHLLGRGGEPVGTLDTWPGGGLAATSQWTPGALMADTYLIEVDEAAATPSVVGLDLYFWDADSLQPLARTTRDGTALPSVTFMVGRVVPSAAVAASPEHVVESQFEHGIELAGYDVSANGALSLTLYWKLAAGERVPGDYTVFVHLVDEQGILVVEPADSPPVDGNWPTSAWEPGQTVADTRLVALPPNLHAGRYSMRVGLYERGSGVRLAAWQADGTPWPGEAVVLEAVVVR